MNPIHPFLVLTTNLLLLGEALANPGNHASKAKTQQQLNNVGIAEWVAFGSGCQASSKKPSPEVQFTTQTGETLLSTLHFKDFRLNLKDTDKGVRECALRMTVEMPPNKRIASIQAQTHIEANKTDGMHLRARVMMLLGDSQIANRVWDLKKNDFAKHRNEQISLLSGSTSETALPKKD